MSRSRALLYQPMRSFAAVISVIALVAIAFLVGTSWVSMQRLAPIEGHVAYVERLEQLQAQLEGLLLATLGVEGPVELAGLRSLRDDLGSFLRREEGYLSDETRGQLQRAKLRLDGVNAAAVEEDGEMVLALTEMRQALAAETQAQNTLMRQLVHDTERVWATSMTVAIALPLLASLVIFLLRHRILGPLRDLAGLMRLLAQRDFRPLAITNADPMLRPLFETYNEMVQRLQVLEEEHRVREGALQAEVERVTRALLQEQRKLARAGRVLVVGEIAASLAHEMRNPLAGIRMALENHRQELDDPEQVERIGLAIGEVDRLTRLLNGMIDHARSRPEAPRDLDVGDVVQRTLSLLRYQVPDHVRLEQDLPSNLRCRLSEDGLRQVLVNLVLNAAQAIGDRAGHIRVQVSIQPGRLLCVVSDDGPGFPGKLTRDGVQPFATMREGGSGLGLATVRRFVRDHDGEIHLANLEPHGACVTLTLPCREQR